MNKSAIVALMALAFSSTSAAEDNIAGKWDCTMVSDYGDFTFVLTLNADKTFVKKQDAFGDVTVDFGKWAVQGGELVMNREKFSKNGEEKASSQEFRREIVSASGSALELKHGDITTTCAKS